MSCAICGSDEGHIEPECRDYHRRVTAAADRIELLESQLAESQRERDEAAKWIDRSLSSENRLRIAVAALEWYASGHPGEVARKALAEIRGESKEKVDARR